MSDIPQFEYKIAADGVTVQVRLRREKQGKVYVWSRYMACDSAEDAKRILVLLNEPANERDWAVMP